MRRESSVLATSWLSDMKRLLLILLIVFTILVAFKILVVIGNREI